MKTRELWIDRKMTEINHPQKESLINLLCKRRGFKKASRIRSIITYDFLHIVPFLSRFYFIDDEAHYCAGQSYSEELTRVVDEIIKRYP